MNQVELFISVESLPGPCAALSAAQRAHLVALAVEGDPELLRHEVLKHLGDAQERAKRDPRVNVALATAIVERISMLLDRAHEFERNISLLVLGAARYFVSSDDELSDFTSFIGFEDDAAVVNALLIVVGLNNHLINIASFDGV